MNRLIIVLLSIIFISCSREMHKARFVLLPDTQYYAEKFPEVLDSQINWIVRNAKDIHLVIQQGDLTQNNNEKEWLIVQQAFSKLNNKLPYVLAVGNHDMGSGPGKFADVRNTELYNQYFPYATMSQLPAFAGAFEANKTDNAYYTFTTGPVKWLVITLEFGPRNSVLEWANQVIAQHPDRTVIINTHSYMYSDSTRQGFGDKWRPQNYGVGKDSLENGVNDGEDMWEKLVKKHPNTRFVFSGHVLNSGVGNLVSINDFGNYVYQMLANYQSETGNPKGGNGWLRILDMNFKKKTLEVKTWSPYLNQQLDKPGHNFIIRHMLYQPE